MHSVFHEVSLLIFNSHKNQLTKTLLIWGRSLFFFVIDAAAGDTPPYYVYQPRTALKLTITFRLINLLKECPVNEKQVSIHSPSFHLLLCHSEMNMPYHTFPG